VTRRIALFLLACAASLAYAAPARADLLAVILADYVDDNQINPCKYTEKQLRTLKDLIPNDADAYAADFGAAVDDALARRAAGACNKGAAKPDATAPPATSGTAPPPPASGTPAPAAPGAPAAAQPPPQPGPQPTAAREVAIRDAIGVAANLDDPSTQAPFPLLALAILAGLLALGTALFGVVRWRAWEPAWADRFRHAAGEAGWRASSTWAEFTDFVRYGR
jgi:hypothetical protein